MSTLKDKVVIITGGGGGIGLAAARGFVGAGAKVLITGRRGALLDDISAGEPNIKGFVADASNPADAPRTISKALKFWAARCSREQYRCRRSDSLGRGNR